jgi:hypothetical protein
MENAERRILREKIEAQAVLLDMWKKPIEPLLFETLRAIDNVFCQELFLPDDSPDRIPADAYSTMSWGVNQALARLIPDEPTDGDFRLFPSQSKTQEQADALLLHAGILEKAERLLGWLDDGLVTARLDTLPAPTPTGIRQILVLKSDRSALYREIISRAHRRWVSDLQVKIDEPWEARLVARHPEMLPSLERNVEVFHGWGITYRTTREIDEYFLEWGQVYLRRMWSQDLLGLEDKIGGYQFNEYLGVLVALAGRAQKHLCYAQILKQRNPKLALQNLLTTYAPYEEFVTSLARHLDGDSDHVRALLSCLILDPFNKDVHTRSGDTAWAPVVRATRGFVLLPLYGLEINPFLFLLADLEARYSDDWFRVANNREKRWLADLKYIFPGNRWLTVDRNVKLREGRTVLTDIDFVAYDMEHDELALFQLKWQKPVGMDNRARRSAGKNLVTEGNRWIKAVLAWLGRNGVEEFARRAGIRIKPVARIGLFVVGRYNASFSGSMGQSDEATWTDWNHLMRVRLENPKASVGELAHLLKSQTDEAARGFRGESYVLPLSDLAVILNPASEPVHA